MLQYNKNHEKTTKQEKVEWVFSAFFLLLFCETTVFWYLTSLAPFLSFFFSKYFTLLFKGNFRTLHRVFVFLWKCEKENQERQSVSRKSHFAI